MKTIRDYILHNLTDIKELDFKTDLFSSGIIDSFSLLDLTEFLVEKFNIQMMDYEIIENDLNTIEKIYNYILETKVS